MKKGISILMAASVLWLTAIQTSCIGTFSLTNKWWDWVSGWNSKFGAGIFYLFLGGLGTAVTYFVDAVILNTIEFWSGDGPLGLKEGEKEQQMVMGTDGNIYEVTATQNRFDIVQMNGEEAGDVKSLVFDPISKSWNLENGCETTKLSQFSKDESFVTIFALDGKMATVPVDVSSPAVAKEMIEEQMASQTCMN